MTAPLPIHPETLSETLNRRCGRDRALEQAKAELIARKLANPSLPHVYHRQQIADRGGPR